MLCDIKNGAFMETVKLLALLTYVTILWYGSTGNNVFDMKYKPQALRT